MVKKARNKGSGSCKWTKTDEHSTFHDHSGLIIHQPSFQQSNLKVLIDDRLKVMGCSIRVSSPFASLYLAIVKGVGMTGLEQRQRNEAENIARLGNMV
jgi:hypothetical protein